MTYHYKSAVRHLMPLLAACIALCSCNKSEDETEVEAIQYTNTSITSFALAADDDVLPYLSTVFFSIDLVDAQVFNAQPLPKGTDVSCVGVTIDTGVLKEVLITFKDASGTEQTVDYLADNDVKVNFATGPATLTVCSYDGTTRRSYTVTVNVSDVELDELAWDTMQGSTLPTTLAAVAQAKAVDYEGKALLLTTDGAGNACMAVADDIDRAVWRYFTPELPAAAVTGSLTATADALYLLDGDHRLHASTDGGATWTDTGVKATHLYGGHQDTLTGCLAEGGTATHITYPGGTGTALPEGFPVSGTSPTATYSNGWMDSPVSVMAGGRLADGTLSGDTWAYDGTAWAKINADDTLPAAEGMTLTAFYLYRRAETSWQYTRLPALVAMGGKLADGTLNKEVYTSTDYGYHWLKATDTMVLPPEGATAYAQTLVYSTLMGSRAGMGDGITPITEWECPYIYLFGGEKGNGALANRMIRGTINRMTLKPLQ